MASVRALVRDVIVAAAGLAVWSAVTQPPRPPDQEAVKPTGLDLAFSEVDRSYSVLLSRLEAAHSRLQALESLALTLTLGVPTIVLAASSRVDFTSEWFYAAGGVFAMLMLVAFVARQMGTFTIPSPTEKLEEGWLSLSDAQYKYSAVYFAGEHFSKNRKLIFWKAQSANIVFGLLVIESVLLLCWLRTAL